MAQQHQRSPSEAELIQSGEPQENVSHVHDAGVTKHPVELALSDRDVSDIEDIADQQDEK